MANLVGVTASNGAKIKQGKEQPRMKFYTLEYKETGYGTVQVEAETLEEAQDKARKAIDNGQFISAEDTYYYDFEQVTDEQELD